MLPDIGNRGVMRSAVRTGFGGLNHNLSAGDGEIYYMENLSSREYPLLSPSVPRGTTFMTVDDIGSDGNMFYVYNNTFMYGGWGTLYEKGTVIRGQKQFALIGGKILIFPDKKYYDTKSNTFGSLDSRVFTTGVQFKNGTIAGVSAAANTIYVPGSEGKFSPGDAVTIVYCTLVPENNKTVVVREVEGNELRFYENTFTLYQDADYTEPDSVGVVRAVPALDYFCVHENRLWGCKYDNIYASALGDPFNFNVFDGLSTDSWSSGTQGVGGFTGCVSYDGYPIFFKEDAIIKVQGDQPSNFRWTQSSRFGVKEGCHRSLAVAGETLFYVSPAGVCAYTGGSPRVISDALGRNETWHDAVAGSDGVRYYVSMKDHNNDQHFFMYDTRYGEWYRLGDEKILSFTFHTGNSFNFPRGLYWVDSHYAGTEPFPYDGQMCCEMDYAADWAAQEWFAEFADSTRFYETTDTSSQDKKGPLRLQLRCSLVQGATIKAWIMYDSDGTWHEIGTVTGETGGSAKRSYNLPLIVRRCDHYRLKLTGTGKSVIYSLTEVKYSGSNLQGGSVSRPSGT